MRLDHLLSKELAIFWLPMSVHECCAGGLLMGGISMNSVLVCVRAFRALVWGLVVCAGYWLLACLVGAVGVRIAGG